MRQLRCYLSWWDFQPNSIDDSCSSPSLLGTYPQCVQDHSRSSSNKRDLFEFWTILYQHIKYTKWWNSDMIMRQYTLMHLNLQNLLLPCSSSSAGSSSHNPICGQGWTNLKDDVPLSWMSTHVNLPGESIEDNSSIPKWIEKYCTCAWHKRAADSIKSKMLIFKRLILEWCLETSNFCWIDVFSLAR